MERKHTPGPWKWDEGWGAIVVDRADAQKLVCPMWTGSDRQRMCSSVASEDIANAQLIAAAPELLKACEVFAEAYRDYIDGDGSGLDYAARVVKGAIAKAEGGDK